MAVTPPTWHTAPSNAMHAQGENARLASEAAAAAAAVAEQAAAEQAAVLAAERGNWAAEREALVVRTFALPTYRN